MYGHIRWLRRYLIWRVALRLGVEGVAVGALVGAGALVSGFANSTAALFGLAAAQLFAAVRLTMAMTTGSVDVPYLLNWQDRSSELVVTIPDEPLDRESHLRLVATVVDPEAALEAEPVLKLMLTESGLTMICVGGDDEPSIALAKLSDGRLLLTTTEVVPPHPSVVVNRCNDEATARLMLAHVEAVQQLRPHGIDMVEITTDDVIDHLRFEWEAWNQLGPFVGSLLSVKVKNRPLELDVPLPWDELWRRSVADCPTARSTPGPPEAEPSQPEPTVAPQAIPPQANPPPLEPTVPTATPVPVGQPSHGVGEPVDSPS